MKRAVVIGNSGGGKSTLARRLGSGWQCDPVEIDGLLWQPGWQLTPAEIYHAEHTRLIGGDSWIIDGLGRLDSIPARLARHRHRAGRPAAVDAFLARRRAANTMVGR